MKYVSSAMDRNCVQGNVQHKYSTWHWSQLPVIYTLLSGQKDTGQNTAKCGDNIISGSLIKKIYSTVAEP